MGKSHLFQKEFPSKENMEMYQNPNKRIRLDLSNNFERNVPNDDLWGAEDLTAEEFDMLEVQATQAQQQDTSFVPPLPHTSVNNVALHQADETKQQLYELEGKIKILSQSLEKVSKELKEEKLKSNKLVNEKTQQSLVKENELRKEIKKVESALQFKDQEMKSVYQKVHLLETQLQEKKEKPTNQTSNSFIEKFKFSSEISSNKPEQCHQNKPKSSRKYKLLVDTPRGDVPGTDMVSTFLCNRLSITPAQNDSCTIPPPHSPTQSPIKHCSQLSAVSILRLGSDQKTEELFDYFYGVFKNYLANLKSAKGAVCSTVNSPSSLRRKESSEDRKIVISCLKDLACIISNSQFISLIRRHKDKDLNSTEAKKAVPPGTSAVHQFPASDLEIDEPEQKVNLLLHSLVSLSSPESYPVNYFKNEEIELSLSCLVSWSALAPESFIPLNDEIPYHLFFCYEDIASLFLSLKLITNLCVRKEFVPVLLHKNDFCLLCAISSLAGQKIPQNPLKFITVMLMIENFLSASFTVHSFMELKLDSSPCSSMVFQGVVISLCKFYEIYQEGSYEIMLVLRKGFTLVHQLSRYLPNCKERRSSFEDSYISLVCGMLTLSKESPVFKEFYDLAHDLWDFQEDTSEFDLDDPSEESSQMVEMMSQSEH